MKTFWVFLLAALCCCSPLQAAAPGLDDFAYGLTLPRVEANGAYSLDLPRVVYEKTTRHDLGDLRVFNGAGETVPHAIRRLPMDEAAEQIRRNVPFFPLPGKRPPAATDLSLRVSRNRDGAVVTVDAGSETSESRTRSSWYLLDTSRLETKPTALELRWDTSSAAIFTVSLAHSSDLTHWIPLVGQTTLADLNYNGSTIAARRIALPGKPLPYIRLDCVDCREPLLLREVTAIAGTAISPDQWQWLRLDAETTGEGKEELVFTYRLDARMTVTALQLRFAETNSLARAMIESRPSPDAPWQTRAQGNFYTLNLQGKALVNEPARCAPNSDRHWRLRVTSGGSGLGGGKQAPRLELGWRREQLVFVGRGAGPYTLAFGSAKLAETGAMPENLVLAAMEDTRSESLIQPIEPGPLQTLGGEPALQSRLSAASWKKILLWAVLIAGVALLAVMARTIYREMQAKKL